MRSIAQIVVSKILVRITRCLAQIKVGLCVLNSIAHQCTHVMVIAQLVLVVECQLALCHKVLLMTNGTDTAFV